MCKATEPWGSWKPKQRAPTGCHRCWKHTTSPVRRSKTSLWFRGKRCKWGTCYAHLLKTHEHTPFLLCTGPRNCALTAKALVTDPLQPHPLCGKVHLADRWQDGPCCKSSGHQHRECIQLAVPSISMKQSLNNPGFRPGNRQSKPPLSLLCKSEAKYLPIKGGLESVLGSQWLLSNYCSNSTVIQLLFLFLHKREIPSVIPCHRLYQPRLHGEKAGLL